MLRHSEITGPTLSYLHTKRSPCLECDNLGVDKNSEQCQLCEKRLKYAASLDEEQLVVFPKFATSRSGNQPWFVHRNKKTTEQQARDEKIIKDFADLYCRINKLSLHNILDMKKKTPDVVGPRRKLIIEIKKKFNPTQKTIARALGIRTATVSLAVLSMRKEKL